jgi:hypothetical protein
MSTATQRLQRDVGATEETLPTVTAQAYLDEAAESYAAGSTAALAYARVLALQGFLASAADEVDYVQNESQEKASQKFENWRRLLLYWQGQVTASGGVSPAIFEVY